MHCEHFEHSPLKTLLFEAAQNFHGILELIGTGPITSEDVMKYIIIVELVKDKFRQVTDPPGLPPCLLETYNQTYTHFQSLCSAFESVLSQQIQPRRRKYVRQRLN